MTEYKLQSRTYGVNMWYEWVDWNGVWKATNEEALETLENVREQYGSPYVQFRLVSRPVIEWQEVLDSAHSA